MRSPEVVVLEDPAACELIGEWRELAARLGDTSYFQTPDWVIAWWETVAQRAPTQLAAWRGADGSLQALVALSRDREPLHHSLALTVPVWVNAGSGAGAADHCGWLVPPECRDAATAWISETIGSGALLLRSADPAQGQPALPAAGRVIDTIACPRTSLPAGACGGGPSPAFQRQLGRFGRRLHRAGVRFEWVAPGTVDEPLLVALLDLHARGRAGRGVPTRFGFDQLALHRRLVLHGAAGRGPAAAVARRGEAIVGVLYGFWWGETFAAYQSGWDPEWSRHSLGSVLIHHAMQFAAAGGARTFDFLRGTESYKARFGTETRRDETWLVPRGGAGALLAARHAVRGLIGSRTSDRRSRPRTDHPAGSPPS